MPLNEYPQFESRKVGLVAELIVSVMLFVMVSVTFAIVSMLTIVLFDWGPEFGWVPLVQFAGLTEMLTPSLVIFESHKGSGAGAGGGGNQNPPGPKMPYKPEVRPSE